MSKSNNNNNNAWLGRKVDPQGIVQDRILIINQMVYARTRISPREWDTQNSLGFWDATESYHYDQTLKKFAKENLPSSVFFCSSNQLSENYRKWKS